MARIPIAQIPNAPQLTQPVLTPTGAPRVNLLSAAEQLNQDTMALDSFSGAAKGLEALGEAGQRVAAVADDFAMRMSRANDTIAQSKAEAALAKKYGEFQIEMQNTPFDKWSGILEERLPEWKREIDGIAMSANARAQVSSYYDQYSGRIAADVGSKANIARIEDGRLAIRNNAERRMTEGDYMGAKAEISRGVGTGLYSKAEADEFGIMVDKRQVIDADEKFNTSVTNFIAENPRGFLEDIADKNSELFPFLNENPAKLEQLRQMANQQVLVLQREAADNLDQAILTRKVRSEEQIRETAKAAGLSERETLSLIKSLYVTQSNTPQARASFLQAQTELMTEVQAYNSATDPDFSKLFTLRQKIRETMPEGERQTFFEELGRIQSQGRTIQNSTRSMVFERIDYLTNNQVFIKFRDVNGKIDHVKSQEAWGIALSLKRDFDEAYRKNPNMTSTEVQAWFNSATKDYIIKEVTRPSLPARLFSQIDPLTNSINRATEAANKRQSLSKASNTLKSSLDETNTNVIEDLDNMDSLQLEQAVDKL